MSKKRSIVLASASPRRQDILRNLGLDFTVFPSGVNEEVEEHDKQEPPRVVEVLAERKAADVASKVGDGLVIGSDTIVVVDGTILGKPGNADEAFHMLSRLEGRIHSVYSGLAIIDAKTGRKKIGYKETKVKMRPVSDEEIKKYISTGEPMDKAGAYAIQGIGSIFIEEIQGEYFSVVGMPISLLVDYLNSFGLSVLDLCLEKSMSP